MIILRTPLIYPLSTFQKESVIDKLDNVTRTIIMMIIILLHRSEEIIGDLSVKKDNG